MSLLHVIAVVVTLTALFSYVNHRFIRLPTAIGVMAIALLASLALVLAGHVVPGVSDWARSWVAGLDFDETLLQGMLSFLLFAGALNVDLSDLAREKWTIASLAVFGTLVSTFLVAALVWWTVGLVGISLSWIHALVFGALISPTDPIAVLGILRKAGAPRSLETIISGESLFNDGVGVVLFVVLLEIAAGAAGHGTGATGAPGVAVFFVQEAVGGVVFGLAIGYAAFLLLRSVDQYQVEVLLTLALVMGGYALASALHVSGPIAIVVAGLFIGNRGRILAMSETTRLHLDVFWELVDEILNAVLFVLVGIEVLVVDFRGPILLASLLVIPLVLSSRLVAVAFPVSVLRRFRTFPPGAIRVMTWGGLRGGISVALALSLPAGPARETIVAITYPVVAFSILVQGLTIGSVVRAGVAGDHDPR